MLTNGSGSINFNKGIAKEYGFNVAILLGFLCYKYDYWIKRNEITEDGYFYVTQEDIEEEVGLSQFKQIPALKKLKELGIVSVYKKGMPAKYFYKINDDALSYQVSKYKSQRNLVTSDEETSCLDTKKLGITNKEELIKETNKEDTNISTNNDISNTPSSEITSVSPKQKDSYLEDSKSAVMVRSQIYGAYDRKLADVIVKWYEAVGIKRKITFKQIKDKLEQLNKECNDNPQLVIQQINYSYLNNYPAWYPPKEDRKNKSTSDSISVRQGEVDRTGYRDYI